MCSEYNAQNTLIVLSSRHNFSHVIGIAVAKHEGIQSRYEFKRLLDIFYCTCAEKAIEELQLTRWVPRQTMGVTHSALLVCLAGPWAHTLKSDILRNNQLFIGLIWVLCNLETCVSTASWLGKYSTKQCILVHSEATLSRNLRCWYTTTFFKELLQKAPKCTMLRLNFKRDLPLQGREIPPQTLSFCPPPVSEILHTPLSQNHTNCLYICVLSGSQPISTTSKQARSSVSMLSAVQLSSHHEPDDGSVHFSAVSCSSAGRHSITLSHELVVTLVMGPPGSFLLYLGKHAKQ